jgi:hypothetical protein
MSRSLLEKHPSLAMNAYVAYQKAKDICYEQLETIGICSPPCRGRWRNFRTGW